MEMAFSALGLALALAVYADNEFYILFGLPRQGIIALTETKDKLDMVSGQVYWACMESEASKSCVYNIVIPHYLSFEYFTL